MERKREGSRKNGKKEREGMKGRCREEMKEQRKGEELSMKGRKKGR